MKKADFILIAILLTLTLSITFLFHINRNKENMIAKVYNNGELVYTFTDLNKEEIFTTKGVNGDVVIETKDGKVRIKEETSPLNICSKQGWTDSTSKPLICLPNKVVVEIVGKDKDDIDAIA